VNRNTNDRGQDQIKDEQGTLDKLGKKLGFLNNPIVQMVVGAAILAILTFAWNYFVDEPRTQLAQQGDQVDDLKAFDKSMEEFRTGVRREIGTVSTEVKTLQSISQQVKEDVAVLKAFPDQARTLADELGAARKAVIDATAEAKKANTETATAIQGIEKRIADAQAKLAQIETVVTDARTDIAAAAGASRQSSTVVKLQIAKLSEPKEDGQFFKADCTFGVGELPLLGAQQNTGIWASQVSLSGKTGETPKAFATARVDPTGETLVVTVWWSRTEKTPEDHLATVTLSWRDS